LVQFLRFLYTHDSGDLTNKLAKDLLPLATYFETHHLSALCKQILGVSEVGDGEKEKENAVEESFSEELISNLIDMGIKRGTVIAALNDLKKAGRSVDDLNVILDYFKEKRQRLVYSHQHIEISDLRPPMIHPTDYIVDLLKVMTDDSFADLQCRAEGNFPIRVHKFMLRARSRYFDNMFASGMKESTEEVIDLTDIKHSVLQELVEFIYTDKIDDLPKDPEDLVYLLEIANRFQLERLKEMTAKVLATSLDEDNVLTLYQIAGIHEAHQLRSLCLNFAMKHWDSVQAKAASSGCVIPEELLQKRKTFLL